MAKELKKKTNFTVSFNPQKKKEKELHDWLVASGDPMATAIKDKLHEYRNFLFLINQLKILSNSDLKNVQRVANSLSST